MTRERHDDVTAMRPASEKDKLALVQDESLPFFTAPHVDRCDAVLVRECRLGEMSRDELAEVIQDAWLSRGSPARIRAWLAAADS